MRKFSLTWIALIILSTFAFGNDSSTDKLNSLVSRPLSDVGIQYLYSDGLNAVRFSCYFNSPENSSFNRGKVYFRGGEERLSISIPLEPKHLSNYGISWTSAAYYLVLNSIVDLQIAMNADMTTQLLSFAILEVPVLLANPEIIYGNGTFSLVGGWNIDTFVFKESAILFSPFIGFRFEGQQTTPLTSEFRVGYNYFSDFRRNSASDTWNAYLSLRIAYFDFTGYRN